MNRIKFSHKYEKLYAEANGIAGQVKLIQVLLVKLEQLSKDFIAYDTDGIYKLPAKGDYLMLVFEKTKGSIFTTLRRFTPNKNEYYRCKVGEYFEIIIEEIQ